jgi:hypothetical protein
MRQISSGAYELDDWEIALAMKIGDRLKLEFAVVVQRAIDAGQLSGVPEQCIMSAIATEALLIAAFCHNGTHASFLQMVELAVVAAASFKADQNETMRIQ